MREFACPPTEVDHLMNGNPAQQESRPDCGDLHGGSIAQPVPPVMSGKDMTSRRTASSPDGMHHAEPADALSQASREGQIGAPKTAAARVTVWSGGCRVRSGRND